MSEFVSLRVPKKIMPKLYRLKAKLMLERERKVSDAEVVVDAIESKLMNEPEFYRKDGVNIWDYVGFIKGGKPSNAAVDVDEVLYGD